MSAPSLSLKRVFMNVPPIQRKQMISFVFISFFIASTCHANIQNWLDLEQKLQEYVSSSYKAGKEYKYYMDQEGLTKKAAKLRVQIKKRDQMNPDPFAIRCQKRLKAIQLYIKLYQELICEDTKVLNINSFFRTIYRRYKKLESPDQIRTKEIIRKQIIAYLSSWNKGEIYQLLDFALVDFVLIRGANQVYINSSIKKKIRDSLLPFLLHNIRYPYGQIKTNSCLISSITRSITKSDLTNAHLYFLKTMYVKEGLTF